MRNLILCLMFGLVVGLAGCADDETNGDINNGGNGGNGGGGGTDDSLRSVTLDHVDGSPGAGRITAGANVVFYLRLTNASGFAARGITNGFRVYSTDGATWGSTVGDSTGTLGKADFDGGMFFNYSDADGSGADTVGFGAFVLQGTGMADGFDDIAYTITIGPINSPAGKHVCIDSSFYPQSGSWLWAFGGSESYTPGWDGPHCFEVVQ